MSLKDITEGYIGDLHTWGVSSFANHLLDAAGEKYAYIFQVPKSGSITHVGFRTTTVTTPQTLKVGLQTLSSGNPSGSAYGSMVAGTQASPASNTYYEVALGTPATAVRGDYVAIVVEWNGSAGNLNIAGGGTPTGNHDFPYVQDFTGGAWNKFHEIGINSIKYSDGTYGQLYTMPAATITEITFNSGSTPDERGIKFKVPFPISLAGVYSRWGSDSGSTFEVVLYDTDGTTVLTKTAVDQANLKGSGNNFKKFLFNASVRLKPNRFYRLTFKPTNTTNCQLYQFTVNSAAMLDGYAGGQSFMLTTRTDAGAWTDSTTTRPLTGVIVDQMNADASDFISL